jgi:heme exporter protein D
MRMQAFVWLVFAFSVAALAWCGLALHRQKKRDGKRVALTREELERLEHGHKP